MSGAGLGCHQGFGIGPIFSEFDTSLRWPGGETLLSQGLLVHVLKRGGEEARSEIRINQNMICVNTESRRWTLKQMGQWLTVFIKIQKEEMSMQEMFMLSKPLSMSPVYLVGILTTGLVIVMRCSLSSGMRTECWWWWDLQTTDSGIARAGAVTAPEPGREGVTRAGARQWENARWIKESRF